jgi:hypothetical protein
VGGAPLVTWPVLPTRSLHPSSSCSRYSDLSSSKCWPWIARPMARASFLHSSSRSSSDIIAHRMCPGYIISEEPVSTEARQPSLPQRFAGFPPIEMSWTLICQVPLFTTLAHVSSEAMRFSLEEPKESSPPPTLSCELGLR